MVEAGPVAESWHVTKDQQIQEALKLLDPPAAEREECLHEIHRALGRVENFTAFARSSRAEPLEEGRIAALPRGAPTAAQSL